MHGKCDKYIHRCSEASAMRTAWSACPHKHCASYVHSRMCYITIVMLPLLSLCPYLRDKTDKQIRRCSEAPTMLAAWNACPHKRCASSEYTWICYITLVTIMFISLCTCRRGKDDEQISRCSEAPVGFAALDACPYKRFASFEQYTLGYALWLL